MRSTETPTGCGQTASPRSRLPLPRSLSALNFAALAASVTLLSSAVAVSPATAKVLPTPKKAAKTAEDKPAAPLRLFSPDSPWNTVVDRGAAIDRNSSAMVSTLTAEVRAEVKRKTGPGFGTHARSPVYSVGPDVPRVPVQLDTGAWGDELQQVFSEGVPIPADAQQG